MEGALDAGSAAPPASAGDTSTSACAELRTLQTSPDAVIYDRLVNMFSARLPVVGLACTGAITVSALTLLARHVADPFWGTSLWVNAAMVVAVAVIALAYVTMDPGWPAWRRALAAVMAFAIAYPGWWAVATLVATSNPTGPLTWALAVLAGVAYIPIVASFALLPLLSVRYVGAGLSRWPGVVILGLAVANAIGFALFFDDFDPFRVRAPLHWGPGLAAAMTVNALFLASVLVGPVVAVRGAYRAHGVARSRLVLVGICSISGLLLVLACGLLGSIPALLCAMYASLAINVFGATRALRTPMDASAPVLRRMAASGLTIVTALAALTVIAKAGAKLQPLPAAAIAIVLLLMARPFESLLARTMVAPAEDLPWASATAISALTSRESEVLGLLAEGLSNSGIAARLVLSERTVDAHLRSIFTKLDLPSSSLDNRRVHAANAWRDASHRSNEAS